MSILEIKNMRKSFGKTEVLKGINLSLEKRTGRFRNRLIGKRKNHVFKVY